MSKAQIAQTDLDKGVWYGPFVDEIVASVKADYLRGQNPYAHLWLAIEPPEFYGLPRQQLELLCLRMAKQGLFI